MRKKECVRYIQGIQAELLEGPDTPVSQAGASAGISSPWATTSQSGLHRVQGEERPGPMPECQPLQEQGDLEWST